MPRVERSNGFLIGRSSSSLRNQAFVLPKTTKNEFGVNDYLGIGWWTEPRHFDINSILNPFDGKIWFGSWSFSFVLPFRNLSSFSPCRWFPGHMHKGMKDLEGSLSSVDGIIEVHDARIPHSGRNPQLYQRLVGGHKPHILLLNKSDLADPTYVQKSVQYIQSEQQNIEVIHTSLATIDVKELSKIFARLFHQILESPRYSRGSTPEYNIVVCGIPNVGKSTFSKLGWDDLCPSLFIVCFSS